MAVQGAYPPGAFGLPPGVNGELAGAAGYGAGLHLVSPQMNGSAAAAAVAAGYGRSPVVRGKKVNPTFSLCLLRFNLIALLASQGGLRVSSPSYESTRVTW